MIIFRHTKTGNHTKVRRATTSLSVSTLILVVACSICGCCKRPPPSATIATKMVEGVYTWQKGKDSGELELRADGKFRQTIWRDGKVIYDGQWETYKLATTTTEFWDTIPLYHIDFEKWWDVSERNYGEICGSGTYLEYWDKNDMRIIIEGHQNYWKYSRPLSPTLPSEPTSTRIVKPLRQAK